MGVLGCGSRHFKRMPIDVNQLRIRILLLCPLGNCIVFRKLLGNRSRAIDLNSLRVRHRATCMFRSIFSGIGFPPRWSCGPGWTQEPWWGWIHIVSDLFIFGAYFAIPVILLTIARQRRDIPFPRIIYLFAAFILACGSTHLLEAIIFYWPIYRFSAILQVITAVVSVATVFTLFDIIPRALQLKSPRQLEREVARQTVELSQLNERLRQEIAINNSVNKELQENRQLLHIALTAGGSGFFDWDLEQDVVTFDAAQMRLTGLGAPDGKVNQDEFYERVRPDYRQRLKAHVQAVLNGSEDYDFRFPFNLNSGQQIWLAGRGRVIRSPEGRALKFIGINQDVTNQVDREEVLDQVARVASTASEQKSRFVAQVSHEIRTPLTVMLGGLDAILPDLSQGETRELARAVRSQGEMLKILLNDVLDLSKIEAGHLEIAYAKTAIPQVLGAVFSLMNPLATEKGLQLHWRGATQLPDHFLCDAYRLRQILINLISNAIKFTSTGRVEVVAQFQPEANTNGGKLTFEIHDTGIGIAHEKLVTIFNEFEQVGENPTGTGLGLAICKRLIDLMHGDITVQSELHNGSVFAFTLPIEVPEDAKLVEIHDISAANNNSHLAINQDSPRFALKVLAAEDTRGIQLVLKSLLGKMVTEFHLVSNGREAIDAVKRAIDEGTPYQLVLMDIQMPEVNGVDATRALRQQGVKVPIVAITAGAMESERQACLTAGCSGFLAKPIDIVRLREILAEAADQQ